MAKKGVFFYFFGLYSKAALSYIRWGGPHHALLVINYVQLLFIVNYFDSKLFKNMFRSKISLFRSLSLPSGIQLTDAWYFLK